MKTKTCPYCGKELSGEAVLCKFCHNLLIDEDGNMTSEGGVGDETKVFTKPDDDMTKQFSLPEMLRTAITTLIAAAAVTAAAERRVLLS